MSEMTAGFGLDTAEFRRGLRQAEEASAKTSSTMESHWGRAGTSIRNQLIKAVLGEEVARRALRFGTDSVREYAKENLFAAESLSRLEGAFDGMQKSMGRGLYLLAESINLSGMIKGIADWQTEKINQWADLISGDPGHGKAIDEALAEQEQQTRLLNLYAKRRDMLNELDLAYVRMSQSKQEADALEEQQIHARNRANIRMSGGVLGADSTQLLDAEERRHHARLYQIEQEADAEVMAEGRRQIAEIKRDAEQRALDEKRRDSARALALENLGFAEDEQRIMLMRLSGERAAADALEAQLRARQRIAEINRNDLLTEEEKKRATDSVSSFLENELDLMGSESSNARRGPSPTIAPGLYSKSLADAVFGPSGGGAPSSTNVVSGNVKEVNRTLKEVQQEIKRLGDRIYSVLMD